MSDKIQLRKKDSKKYQKNEEKPKKSFRNIDYGDDEEGSDYDSDYKTIDDEDEEEEDEEEEDEEEDEDDEENEDEEYSADDEEDEEEELNEEEKKELKNLIKVHKLVNQLYPSKYSKEKVKKDQPIKKYLKDKPHKYENKKSKKTDKKENKKVKFSKSRLSSDTDDEDEDDDDSDYDEDENNKKKFNIVFTIGDGAMNDEYNSEYEDEEDEEKKEKEEEDSEAEEQTFMKEKYINIPYKMEKPEKKGSEKKGHEKKDKKDEEVDLNIEEEYAQLAEMKKEFVKKLEKNPKNKYYLEHMKKIKEDIKKLVQKGRKKNAKQYYKLINAEYKRKSELDYFEKKLSHSEQIKIMNEMKEINNSYNVDKPQRLVVLESNMPYKVKSIALQKINTLKMMEPGDPEYFKMKNWVDAFMKIPFGKNKNLAVDISHGIDACHDFMENAYNILNECAYGMNDAKMQIMQLIGQWIANPEAMGNAIALHGPPGSGKTSIVKDGISKILGRDFVFIPLGGCTDGSYLEGHSYTWEGSIYGKIVQSLIECGSMNPVIFFDELDKVSDSPRGQEIIGILTHLTDTSQNSQFHDKYFSEIDFDLSKCLFIFSYNDGNLINPILKDRMYKIATQGYQIKEKVIIGKKYLIPKILKQIKFSPEDIVIPDSAISYIAENYTQKEEGVRNLKRCLEIIYTKLNLFRLVKPNTTTFFSKDIQLSVSFPHTLTNGNVDILIKSEQNKQATGLSMYI
jgi:ATP-dependent Lon protease